MVMIACGVDEADEKQMSHHSSKTSQVSASTSQINDETEIVICLDANGQICKDEP
jgi:hypothetical protein